MKDRNLTFWFAIFACIALLGLAISSVSLWIDEGFIVWVVSHQTFAAIVQSASSPYAPSPGDRQYPLYDLYIWAWIHVFGTNEIGMRVSNLPFGAIYVLGLAFTSRFAFQNRFAWIPFAFIPFVWFYLNEIRPYMMLSAFACATVSALIIFEFGDRNVSERALQLVVPFFLVAWLTHILAILLMPAIILISLSSTRFRRKPTLTPLIRLAVIWAVPFLLIATYYATTLVGGAAGAELSNNNRGNSSLASLAEITYEQFGFGGLGPSRIALHESVGFSAYKPYIAYIFFGITGLFVAVYTGTRGNIQRTSIVLFAGWLISLSFATLASELTHARFLGRHLAGTFPLLALAGIPLSRSRIAFMSLLAIFLVSDYRLSHVTVYTKDDYRAAVAAVLALNNDRPGTIDWAADDLTAGFYGLNLNFTRNDKTVHVPWHVNGHAIAVQNYPFADVKRLISKQQAGGKPVYLALSRPEIFDVNHGWRDMLKSVRPQFITHVQAFDVFEFTSFTAPKSSNLKER